MTAKSPRQVWSKSIHFLSLGFGTGLSPVAPGTVGSLAGVVIYLLIQDFNLWLYAIVVSLMILIGFWVCGETAKELGVHDHPSIVWDEIVGYLLTMFLAPTGWLWVILGFIYFRIFDIWKPWPIKLLDEKVKGGFGIVLDDLLAGVYAFILLQFSAWFLMPFFSS